jgi:hypothetical protein
MHTTENVGLRRRRRRRRRRSETTRIPLLN